MCSAKPFSARTPGKVVSKVFSVGSICEEIFWINLVFSSLCSLAICMAFFCFRVRRTKRSNTIPANTSAVASSPARMQSPMIMYCLADSELSFSSIVCRLSSYLRFSTFSSSWAVRAFTESLQRMYLSYVRATSPALFALRAISIKVLYDSSTFA